MEELTSLILLTLKLSLLQEWRLKYQDSFALKVPEERKVVMINEVTSSVLIADNLLQEWRS